MNERAKKRLEAARAAKEKTANGHGGARRGTETDHSIKIRQTAFLAALAQAGGVVCRAAQLCEIPRENHWRWLRDDPTYEPRVRAAIEEANDAIETEIIRRGLHGHDEPIVHQGKISVDPQTGQPLTVRRYDTTLLIFLAKAKMPEKYRERIETETKGTLNVNHAGDISLSVAAIRQSLLNDPEYLEFQRQRALREDGQPGDVRANGFSGPLENGAAPGLPRSSANGHH